MSASYTRYLGALEQVAATAGAASRSQLGIALEEVEVRLVTTSPGAEVLAAIPPATVHLAVSDPGQLRPPPAGSNVLYGLCHEVGHLVTAATLPAGRHLPVVWDEALAHLLAVDVLLPAVWAAHGDSLWPDPYPDYLEREARLPTEPQGLLHGSVATLGRTTAQLRAIAGEVGVHGLLAALREVPPRSLRVEELGRALERISRTRPDGV